MLRILWIGVSWTALWAVLWTLLLLTIAVLRPGDFDSGEGPAVLAAVLGPMGLFTGLLFGVLLAIRGRGRADSRGSLARIVGLGILAAALVQIAYLNHGDDVLIFRLGVAAFFSAFGGFVTLIWLLLARGGTPGRDEATAPR
ncbi:MAG: hypothetical protein IT458_00130 [Planctomycetes bacterium]|nr:hypothetical protein [Planctomycetota bacterium]